MFELVIPGEVVYSSVRLLRRVVCQDSELH